MDTTYPQKARALLTALASRPADVPRYLAQLPLWRRQPADLELPWLSYGAIDFLKNYLRPSHRVFEYGSGGSTFFLARRTAQVLSMENHPEWHRVVTTLLAQRHVTNAAVELHPLADDALATFERSPFSQRIRQRAWDVVVVDCYCGHGAARYGLLRPAALQAAFEQTAVGGLVVLDDSWMFQELLVARPGWRVTDFRGCGPCRYGVTSTAIFERLS
jgi:hypothetical protein